MELRSEETAVGLISLLAAAWIVWILVRAVRDARLPIGKGEVRRDERPAAFRALFGFYVLGGLAMAFVGFDLLTGFTGN